MSVSVSQNPNVDLDSIVTGGDAFLARMKAFKDAKAEHDDALNNLRLGHDVVRAMQDVQVREQAVIDTTEGAKTEAEKIIADAKANAEGIRTAANSDAEAARAKAAAEGDALAREVDEAHASLSEWSEKKKSDANELMNAAVAAKAEAEKLMAKAHQAHAEAIAMMTKANAHHEAGMVRHAALKDWVASLPPE